MFPEGIRQNSKLVNSLIIYHSDLTLDVLCLVNENVSGQLNVDMLVHLC